MSTSAWFERLSDPRPPTGTPVLFDRAVVMGGSVAGLMAGRVLADRTDEVIIVEFSGDAATSVRVEAGGAETVERADFVVDAMGRSSRLGDWLEQAGWQRAPMQRMTVDLNYASAVFRRDDEPPYTFVLNAYSPQTSSTSAGASVSQIEGDRWLVLVAGYADHRPGQTIEDLIRVCREELTPEYAHAVSGEVVEGVRTYRHPGPFPAGPRILRAAEGLRRRRMVVVHRGRPPAATRHRAIPALLPDPPVVQQPGRHGHPCTTRS
ncbi:hypothetical protein [Kutzneria sp. 744]|uniref:hypothetical protein n=1 Tax=Kutzneria sp. (strain 744) TaxID=345341 RepID=UPI0003EEB87E|nr:hypothetical protein [Kutzneria sp. 744]EWM18423.1 phytoene dehydrogenase [Kutzneria sp. 744]